MGKVDEEQEIYVLWPIKLRIGVHRKGSGSQMLSKEVCTNFSKNSLGVKYLFLINNS